MTIPTTPREAVARPLILTYRYRIKDASCAALLRQHAWACNQAWNWCVAYQRNIDARYRAGAPKRKWPTHFDLTYQMAGASADLGVTANSLNEVCRYFVQSRNAAKHPPRFRASGGPKRALGWVPFRTGDRRVDGGTVTYRGHAFRFWEGKRPVPETSKGGCFVEDARGRWYVCFYVEVEQHETIATGEIGIDLGLITLATCSDGAKIENRRVLSKYADRMAVAQRAGNKRQTKAIHARIANVRKNFLHKATTALVRENRLIVVGDVNSAKMAKTRFAKSALDASWSSFRSQLRYKCQQAGAVFVEADERNTSRMCSSCGVIPDSSPKGMGALGIRFWRCEDCGTSHDRDINAAINIREIGRAVAARADESRSVVQ